MKKQKQYYKVIQQFVGGVWVDVAMYETDLDFVCSQDVDTVYKRDLIAYRFNGFPTIVAQRTVKIKLTVKDKYK